MAAAAVPFFEMFPDCDDGGLITELCSGAEVIDATIDTKSRAMNLNLSLKTPTAPVMIRHVEQAIAESFSLNSVKITPIYPIIESKAKKKAPPQDIIFGRSAKNAPKLTYKVTVPESGDYCMVLYVNPSNPYSRENVIRFGVSVNDGKMRNINMIHPMFAVGDGNPFWSLGVIENTRKVDVTLKLKEGINEINIYALDPNLVLQKIVLCKDWEMPAESCLGPKETFRF